MRLLEAASIHSDKGLNLVSFNPDQVPPYAILSHMWGHSEVLYTDVVDRTSTTKAAYSKIKYACEQAITDKYEYVWIDTCCIDKRSSAELSEAINSMFEWYRKSEVCYAFVSDFMGENGCDSFDQSKWFTRGWTLQELLAPKSVIFYAAGWIEIGTKAVLSARISSFANIGEQILLGILPIETASIANRMGWAAHRVTTRPEDLAYSLMGVFHVNMPLLYGEGAVKAFFRLQEEIMKSTNDHTLFAWVDNDAHDDQECGMLAPSPSCFAPTSMVVPYEEWTENAPHSWTNKGLLIELRLRETDEPDIYVAQLNCPPADLEEVAFLCIYLKRTSQAYKGYARVRASHFAPSQAVMKSSDEPNDFQRIYVRQSSRKFMAAADMVFPYHFVKLRSAYLTTGYHFPSIYSFERSSAGMVVSHRIMMETRFLQNLAPVMIRRGAGKVTMMALVMPYKKNARELMLSIGSIDAVRLAFDLREGTAQVVRASVIERMFRPRPLGEIVEISNYRATVRLRSTEIKRTPDGGHLAKYYQLSFELQEIQTPPETVPTPPASEVSSGDVSSTISSTKAKFKNLWSTK